jgi:hypothetical protein
MIQHLGVRVVLSCLLQVLLHILFYGGPFPFLALILYSGVAVANLVALLVFTYQAFQQQRPILALFSALAAFPALLLGGILLTGMLSRR